MHLKFNRMAHKILLFVYFQIKISDVETTVSRLTEKKWQYCTILVNGDLSELQEGRWGQWLVKQPQKFVETDENVKHFYLQID